METNLGVWALSAGLASVPITAEAFNCNTNSYTFNAGSTGSGDPYYSADCTYTTQNTPTNMCLASIGNALTLAKRFFANCTGTFTITFSGTTYDFSNETTLQAGYAGAIDLGSIQTCASNSQQLVITGKLYSGMPNLANKPPTKIITNVALVTNSSSVTIANAIDGNASSSQSMSHIIFKYLAFAQSESLADTGSNAGGYTVMNSGSLYGATQGVVLSYPGSAGPGTNPYAVTVEISPGFPYPTPNTPSGNPYGFFNVYFEQGRYMRAYTNSATDPQLVASGGTINNTQVAWGNSFAGCPASQQNTATLGTTTYQTCLPLQDRSDPSKWTFYLDSNSWPLPTPSSTTIVCIKSKEFWDNAFYLDGHGGTSSDIVFDHILWIGMGRGIFRGGMTGLQITNSAVVPPPPIVANGVSQAPCIGGSEGGPQIGQSGDAPTNSNTVNNFAAPSMGDNALGFFGDNGTGATTSSVMNTTVSDGFATPISLSQSPNVYLGDPKSPTDNTWSWTLTGNSLTDADVIPLTSTYYYPRNNPNNLTIPNPPPPGLKYYP